MLLEKRCRKMQAAGRRPASVALVSAQLDDDEEVRYYQIWSKMLAEERMCYCLHACCVFLVDASGGAECVRPVGEFSAASEEGESGGGREWEGERRECEEGGGEGGGGRIVSCGQWGRGE